MCWGQTVQIVSVMLVVLLGCRVVEDHGVQSHRVADSNAFESHCLKLGACHLSIPSVVEVTYREERDHVQALGGTW